MNGDRWLGWGKIYNTGKHRLIFIILSSMILNPPTCYICKKQDKVISEIFGLGYFDVKDTIYHLK
jgi:hypothetical protein